MSLEPLLKKNVNLYAESKVSLIIQLDKAQFMIGK